MDTEERSRLLFGRFEALLVYRTIAELAKSEFTTLEVHRLSGVAESAVSRELARLTQLGYLRKISRRGNYVRQASVLWQWVHDQFVEWEGVGGQVAESPLVGPS